MSLPGSCCVPLRHRAAWGGLGRPRRFRMGNPDSCPDRNGISSFSSQTVSVLPNTGTILKEERSKKGIAQQLLRATEARLKQHGADEDDLTDICLRPTNLP